MKINDAGLALIKRSEGLRLDAYKCPAGVWTIGYGSTAHVTPGMRITPGQAERLLHEDLGRFEEGVTDCLGDAPTTSNQFSAMVSFAFNLGVGALARSTLLRLHRAGNYAEAAAEFPKWDRGGGRVLPGLVARREAERALYSRPDV